MREASVLCTRPPLLLDASSVLLRIDILRGAVGGATIVVGIGDGERTGCVDAMVVLPLVAEAKNDKAAVFGCSAVATQTSESPMV